jgi:hypothetical protein
LVYYSQKPDPNVPFVLKIKPVINASGVRVLFQLCLLEGHPYESGVGLFYYTVRQLELMSTYMCYKLTRKFADFRYAVLMPPRMLCIKDSEVVTKAWVTTFPKLNSVKGSFLMFDKRHCDGEPPSTPIGCNFFVWGKINCNITMLLNGTERVHFISRSISTVITLAELCDIIERLRFNHTPIVVYEILSQSPESMEFKSVGQPRRTNLGAFAFAASSLPELMSNGAADDVFINLRVAIRMLEGINVDIMDEALDTWNLKKKDHFTMALSPMVSMELENGGDESLGLVPWFHEDTTVKEFELWYYAMQGKFLQCATRWFETKVKLAGFKNLSFRAPWYVSKDFLEQIRESTFRLSDMWEYRIHNGVCREGRPGFMTLFKQFPKATELFVGQVEVHLHLTKLGDLERRCEKLARPITVEASMTTAQLAASIKTLYAVESEIFKLEIRDGDGLPTSCWIISEQVTMSVFVFREHFVLHVVLKD